MQYLCLVYIEEGTFDTMPEAEQRALTRDSLARDAELRQDGRLLSANALDPVSTAITVRVRDGRLSTTDGPFAETKEYLGGYFLIEARDMNDAIAIAASMPMAKIGSVEVRPVTLRSALLE